MDYDQLIVLGCLVIASVSLGYMLRLLEEIRGIAKKAADE